MDTNDATSPMLSFEFFPPRTPQGKENIKNTATQLAQVNPAFFSVTFGAGGSSQDATVETLFSIAKNTHIETAPHISCIGSSKESIAQLINTYKDNQIKRLVALRGDLPSGMVSPGEFCYANELIAYIREQTGDYFHIEVAAYPEFHPQCQSPLLDLGNFKRKVDAGADSAITQYFYNPDAYFHFIDNCQAMDINIPIVPGIMPITNHVQLARFSDNCGAEIPRWVRKRLAALDNDAQSILAFGVDVVTELCAKLLEQNAPGLHFYTLNKAQASLAICRNLGFHKKTGSHTNVKATK